MTRKELDDILAIEVKPFSRWRQILCRLHILEYDDSQLVNLFISSLRHSEYYKSNLSKGIHFKIRYVYWRNRMKFFSNMTMFQIPLFTCGPGLRIFHCGPIIINCNARIGSNCTFIGSALIGHRVKNGIAPLIGNNVFIGTNSCILGDVKIGNNAIIGQNVVINKDVPDNAMVLAHQPRVLPRKN